MEGYIKTDIGLIPQDWNLYKLGDVATFRRGSFPQPYGLDKWYDDDNGYPFVQVYDVGDNLTLKETTKRKISKEAAEMSVLAKKGTLLLTIQGSIGRMAIAHYDTYVDRTLLIFSSFKVPIDKHFFMFTVFRLFELEKQRAHGSTIKTITKAQLTDFQIPLPSYSEQQKIATILSTVDEKIEVINQQIFQTEELKKALMQRLLTKGIGHTRFKDSILGKIPEVWEVRKIGEITKVVRGASPRPKGDPRYYGGDVPRLMGADVTRDGKYVTPCIDFLTEAGAEKSRFMRKGTLVMICSGDVGVSAILDVDACVHDGFLAFPEIHHSCSVDYLYYIFDSLHSKFNSSATHGGVFTNLTTTIIKEFEVPVPSLKEQRKMSEVFSAVDEKLDLLNERKRTIENLKEGLMQKLLTGHVRVNNPVEA